MWRCSACEVEFAEDRAGMAYASSFYEGDPRLEAVETWSDEEIERWGRSVAEDRDGHPDHALALEWIRSRLPPGAPVLDYGFGSGYLLAALRAHGYLPLGYEVSSRAIDAYARRGYHVADRLPLPFDVAPRAVVCMRTIEHVRDPVGFLATLRKSFDCPLIVSCPSQQGVDVRFGLRDPADHPPHHLFRYHGRSLRTALELAGYRRVALTVPPATPRELATGLLANIHYRVTRPWATVSELQVRTPLPRPSAAKSVLMSVATAAAWPLAKLGPSIGLRSRYLVAFAEP